MLGKLAITMIFCVHSLAEPCVEQNKVCTLPNQTRKVNGTDVFRDCWEYSFNLNCANVSKNDCSQISSDTCTFIGEECLKPIDEDVSICANLERRYSCEKIVEYEEDEEVLRKNGETVNNRDLLCKAMCIDGNCDAVKKASVESNNELAQSVAMLHAAAAIKSGLQPNNSIVNIFKGYSQECRHYQIGFMNCCKTSPKGWGKAIGFDKCSSDERNLSKLRADRKCIAVGNYYEETLGIRRCKTEVFCCFDSVISRIINEEAKKQLGKKYGTPETPDCSGIELDDLQNIDLTKANFEDFYETVVVPSIKLPDVKADFNSITTGAAAIASKAPRLREDRKGYNEDISREQALKRAK